MNETINPDPPSDDEIEKLNEYVKKMTANFKNKLLKSKIESKS